MKLSHKPGWLIDAVGALIVVTALSLAAWFGVVRRAQAQTLLKDRRAAAAKCCATLSSLNVERSEQERALVNHEQAIVQLGGGGKATTVEAYLETVAALSRKYDVRVFQNRPLGERVYPGLEERLFSFQVGGTTKNLWALLRAIEEIDAWADVSYLKLQGGASDAERVAFLTISMFFEREFETSSSSEVGAGE